MDTLPRGLFVTATGTGCGKTQVARALTLALRNLQRNVAALKPIETGCAPQAADALALAEAAGQPNLAAYPELYRARLPLSPYAVTRETGAPAPDLPALVRRIQAVAAAHELTIVEGAGGLLVPLDATHTIAELAKRLGYPLLLVAPDALGVLSHVLTAYECAVARKLTVAAVILVQLQPQPLDESAASNHRILSERIPAPVLRFPHLTGDGADLIRAAHASGLLRVLGL